MPLKNIVCLEKYETNVKVNCVVIMKTKFEKKKPFNSVVEPVPGAVGFSYVPEPEPEPAKSETAAPALGSGTQSFFHVFLA